VHWNGKTRLSGRPLPGGKNQIVFVDDMSDWLHPDRTDAEIEALLRECAAHPDNVYLLLTKRIARLPALGDRIAVPNAWIGATTETTERLHAALPCLDDLHLRGWHTWLSIEPLLEPLPSGCIPPWLGWCVAGAETGPGARPCKPEWLDQIARDCYYIDLPLWGKAGWDGSDDNIPRDMPATFPAAAVCKLGGVTR